MKIDSILRKGYQGAGLLYLALFLVYFGVSGGCCRLPGFFGLGRLMFMIVPVLYGIGLYVSLGKERVGGFMMVGSVILYNIIPLFIYPSVDIKYWYLLIIGAVPLYLSFKKKEENREEPD